MKEPRPRLTRRLLGPSDLEDVLRLLAPEAAELKLETDDLARNLLDDPDSRAALNLGLFDEGLLCAVACGVVRATVGYLKVLVVRAERRRSGVGGALLREIEERMGCSGAGRVRTDGAAPVYLFPGLPERAREARRFLEGRGYGEVEARFSLRADLTALDLETSGKEAALGAEVAVRRAGPEDEAYLRGQVGSLFSPDWALEVVSSLARKPPGTHIAVAGGRLAGFASAAVWARNAFGPMGTAPAFEARGVGEVLLKRCLADLRAAGEPEALIAWIGPEEFYRRKLGTVEKVRYAVMEKAL